MIHACILSTISGCWYTVNARKEGILSMGSGSTGGDKEGQGRLYRRGYVWTSPWKMLGFHLAERGTGMGSHVLQAHDLGLMYCTVARNSQSSRESLIMEWIKHKTKNSTAVDCSMIAYPEFLFSLSAVRLVFHILGCHILGNKGTTSQPALLATQEGGTPTWVIKKSCCDLGFSNCCDGAMPLEVGVL